MCTLHVCVGIFRSATIAALRQIPHTKGSTDTAGALAFLRNVMFTSANGDRADVKNVAVVITDGESDNRTATLQEAVRAMNDGTHMIALAVGNWLDRYEINSIASYPSRVNAIFGSNFTSIASFAKDIQLTICDSKYQCGFKREKS